MSRAQKPSCLARHVLIFPSDWIRTRIAILIPKDVTELEVDRVDASAERLAVTTRDLPAEQLAIFGRGGGSGCGVRKWRDSGVDIE